MFRFLAPLVALFATCALVAQTPYLVKDINTSVGGSTRDSLASNFVEDGGAIYFSAVGDQSGQRLWKYSGGQAVSLSQTGQTGRIYPLGNGISVFAASWSSTGVELWRTDGTPAGTFLLKDTNPTSNGQVIVIGVFNGKAYFYATTASTGRELWVSDGTEAGTMLLRDFNGTAASSSVRVLSKFGDHVAIVAQGGLWLTDGSPAGTTLVKGNIGAGAGTVVGAKIFLAASDATYGEELWVSDGTEAGTQRAVEINPTTASSFSDPNMVPLGAGVAFFGTDGGSQNGLWFSDGTPSGTRFLTAQVASYCGSCQYGYATLAGGWLYFNTATELWRSDGTIVGTIALDEDASIAPFDAFGAAYYVIQQADTSLSLRRTDGTVGGTTTAMTFPAGTSFVSPAFVGGKLFFQHNAPPYGAEPWVSSDGTTMSLLANINPDLAPSSDPRSLHVAGNGVFFNAFDGASTHVWHTDGTEAGTAKASTFDSPCATAGACVSLGSTMFFRKNSVLWRSDGTAAGTVTTTLFGDGTQPEVLRMFASADRLYLVTSVGLYVSDGVTAQQLTPSSTFASHLAHVNWFGEIAGRVYFTTSYLSSDRFLWETNGTNATTRILGQFSATMVAAGDALYFLRGAAEWPRTELVRTDGTAEGTRVLGTFDQVDLASLTPAGRQVFFIVTTSAGKKSLWRTDGTASGTVNLLTADTGTPSSLTAAGDALFFYNSDDIYGRELWRSDGTPEGTAPVKDIAPPSLDLLSEAVVAADGEVYFGARDAVHGQELWRSDGTEAGTSMVADIAPGSVSANPRELVKAGRRIIFRANNDVHGFEPWALDLSGSALTIADARIAEGNAGSATLHVTVTREGDLSQTASAHYETEDGSAQSGTDYTATAGTVSFAIGQASATIDIAVVGDPTREPNESFSVVLSSPAGAALQRARALAVIADDDQRVDLAVRIATTGTADREIVVSNGGPSTATGVQLRITESPSNTPFRTIDVAPIEPGASRTVTFANPIPDGSSPSHTFLPDFDLPPGYTITAVASSAEAELNPADNTQAKMIDSRAWIILPPFMAVQSADEGKVRVTSGSATLSAASLLTITPETINSAPEDVSVSLVAGNVAGRTLISMNGQARMTYPVVGVGQTAKLDTALSVIAPSAAYGTPLQFQAFIRGARPDGTLPTGLVTFKDNGNGVLAQAALDANGSVTFTRSGIGAGSWPHWIEYAGDGNFNPMHARFYLTFTEAPTTTTGTLARTSCYTAEGKITVKAATTPAPQGAISVTVNGITIGTFTLAASATPGEAEVMVRVTVPSTSNQINFYYVPAQFSSFAYSDASQTLNFTDCAGLGTSLYVMTPCRIIDTRSSSPLAYNATRTVQVTGRCNVPAGAKSVAANVTVVSPSTTGYLRLLPSGVLPRPNTSTVSYRANKTRANNTIIMLNSDGAVDVYNGGAPATHFIIDVSGYYK